MSQIDMSELVTRAILKEELAELRAEIRRAFEEFEQRYDHKLDQKLDARFEQFRRVVAEDTQSAMRMVMADFQRSMMLALEPTRDLTDRVEVLETLPGRVAKLEAKVFPPKRAARRR